LRDIWTQGLDGTAADFVWYKYTLNLGVFSSVGEEASTELGL